MEKTDRKSVILEVKNVKKRFGGIQALKGVSVTLYEGEILGLIGPNGAGKTTLFNCIAGVYHPDEGEILFKGHRIEKLSPNRIAGIGIARTFQIVRPFKTLSVIENVMVALGHRNYIGYGRLFKRPKRDDYERAMELLKTVGLDGKKDEISANLSLGELRRLEVARALALNPEIILLDEPYAGLRRHEEGRISEMILDLKKRGLSIIIVEHRVRLLMELVERVVVLDMGEIIAEGSPEEVKRNPRVIKAYLGEEEVA